MLVAIPNERVVKDLNGFLDFLLGMRRFTWGAGEGGHLDNARPLT